MKTKHTPVSKFVPPYRELTKMELERINAQIQEGILQGMIDGEEATQVLYNLIHTRRYAEHN